MRRTILAVAAAIAVGCGGTDEGGSVEAWPEVSESYSLRGEIPSCWDVVREEHLGWLSPPEHFCGWANATLEGAPHASVGLRWRLDGERWVEVARDLRGL